jgi:hypothetical protein
MRYFVSVRPLDATLTYARWKCDFEILMGGEIFAYIRRDKHAAPSQLSVIKADGPHGLLRVDQLLAVPEPAHGDVILHAGAGGWSDSLTAVLGS